MDEVLAAALDAASDGATYADVRGVELESEALSVREAMVEELERSESSGFGVRVLAGGAWGYAASSVPTIDEAVRVGRAAVAIAKAAATAIRHPIMLADEPVHIDTWATPVEEDPFAVSLEDKVALLVSAAEPMARVDGIRVARGHIDLRRERTLFLSVEGSRIDQTVVHTAGGIEAIAVGDDGAQWRSYPGSFRGHFQSGGFEIVRKADLPGNAERTAEEASALLSAPECPDTVTTVVLDANQVMLQVHESIGHPTELDRVLGMEAAFAGTSFVGTNDLGSLRYGSPLVNVVADATVPGGLGTFGYDDEGVEAQRSDLIRDGILVGFQTSRETAGAVGAPRSNGTMRAQGWPNLPLIRMTNINLLPGEGSLDDLLADVGAGIYMATNRSWSIDDKRRNFQFGCEIAWEIRNGKLGRMLRNPRYTGVTTEFWGSCDAIAGDEEWILQGTPNCGKGQPGQSMRVGHGTSPARFRNVHTGTSQ